VAKTKGFRRPVKTITLVCDETFGDLAGLELELKTSVGMEFYYDILTSAFTPSEEPEEVPKDPDDLKVAIRAAAVRTVERLRDDAEESRSFAAETLVGWNLLDDDDKPVPATPDEFVKRLSSQEIGLIVGHWLRQLREGPPPLALPSESGGTSEEPKA
jgi:hypothetical protein